MVESMMCSRLTQLALFMVLTCANTFAQTSEQLKKLYDDHDWFQLRETVLKGNGHEFYRGVIASISNDVNNAERYLRSVINSRPGSSEANDAYSLLAQTYIRAGRYRQALSVVDQALKSKPDSESFRNARRLLGALSKYPEQSVAARRFSRLRYTMKDGNLFVPVEVNGQALSGLVDTGANFSLITAAEAKRLGLMIRDGEGSRVSDSSGANVDFQLAIAEKLTLGKVELRNVVFFVMRDDQQPFVSLQLGERAIVGLPILLALQNIRFERNGLFDVAASINWRRSSNMYFEGSELILAGEFAKNRIKMFLDTGATRTRVLPLFAKQFASFVNENGMKSSDRITGVGSSVDVESMMLPELRFRMTGTDLVLKPAQVMLKDPAANSRWYHVWIGMDLLRQPQTVTIDFEAMRFDAR